ncbi:MAG: tetrahydromethanopterin S-methyltransferase, partial [Candidatus Lindowbacteria bacterium]|nr:tetrahydromethanopterin S-methyltransferase [Candidatus Lindowbacteria bacterium]
MKNFIFEKVQSVFDVGGVKIGGQPGVNPTVLIGSMFHKGDKLIEDRKTGSFDKGAARQRLKRLEEISQKTGIPAMVDIVANSADEFSRYIEFVVTETGAPVCIDAWQPRVRIEAARCAARSGLLERLIYNSLNPWNKDLEAEVNEIAEIGVRHVVVCVF